MKKQILLILMLIFVGYRLIAQTIYGIDVSHWQGTINWTQVSASGKVFAFAKATEGMTGNDATFSTNMINGNSAGVVMGAYHLARPDNNAAVDEANHFISIAGSYIGAGHLPPALDLEPVYAEQFSKSALSAWVQTWLTTVQNATGVAPIIYTTHYDAAHEFNNSLNIYKLWIANYPTSPTTPPSNLGVWPTWAFDQYSETGTVSGINGNIDLDVFNGNTTAFNNLIGGNPCTPPTATVNNPSGTSSVTITCTGTGGSGGSILYKWYSGTSCSGSVLGTSPTYTANNSGYYACKAYISGYESTCYSCAYGFATIGTSCTTPNSTVNSPTGTGSVAMTCTVSGGSGGSILYKWYSGTSCSGSVLGTNSTYTATTSGYYACKAYINGFESTCYSCAYGYATVGTACNLTDIVPILVSIGTSSSPGQTISTTTPMLTWNAITGATNYGVYIKDVTSNTLVYTNNCATSTTNFVVPASILINNGQYRWNIIATSSCGSSCTSDYATPLYFNISISTCTSPNASVNSPSGTSSVTMTCTSSGGSGGSILYKWYSGTTCSGTVLGTSSTYTATASGYYSCKAYISGYESTCYSCAQGYATIGASCNVPNSTVNSPSGTGSVSMICAASGGSGGSILYKWYSGTSCSGTVLGTSSTYSTTASGNYACKAYISGFESTCYSCAYGYGTVISSCTYTLPVTSATFTTSGGGNNTFSVNTQTGCVWTATTGDPSWITLNTANGTGTGNVNYSVASNSGNSRTGYIYAQGNTFTIYQAGGCQIPTAPVPNFGNATCPGPALYNPTSIFLFWSNSGSVYYDVEIREYPYEASNVIFTQSCVSGNNFSVNSPNILPGKLYAWRVKATVDCNICNSAYSALSYFQVAPTVSPNGTIYVCDGTGVTLSTPVITVPSPGNVSYQWYIGAGINSTPIGNNSNTYFATTSGNYYVKNIYSGSTICSGNDTTGHSFGVNVSVSTTPNAPTLSSNSPVCEGSNLTLSATGPSNSAYYWTRPNGFNSGGPSSNISTVSVADSGTYNCFVTLYGCQSSTSTINVQVKPSINASFTYSVSGTIVTFTNTSTNATSYNWDFGDGQTSSLTSPIHTYSSNSNFNVCLTAISIGCNPNSNCQLLPLGSGLPSSTMPTFAKLFNDTVSSHSYWNCIDIVQSTVDSGYIAIGNHSSSSNNIIQYFKIDKNGNLVWVRELPANGDGIPFQIINSQDGYLISCYYGTAPTIIKIDEQGNQLWTKQFPNFGGDVKLKKIANNGYVMLSNSNTFNSVTLMKINNLGSIIWQKEYDYSLYSSTEVKMYNFIQDPNGNFYVFGRIGDGQAPYLTSEDALIVKIDSSGNHIWSKYYGNANIGDWFDAAIINSNSNIVLSGLTRNSSNSIHNVFFVEINFSGTVLNSKQIPNVYYAAINLCKSGSSNIVCPLTGWGNYKTFIELNSSLNITNQKDFKLKSVTSLKSTFDNKFIAVGQYLFNPSNSDYRYNIFKISLSDNSCIDTVSASITLNSLAFSFNTLSASLTTPTYTANTITLNTVTSNLKDTSLCHICNLSANINSSGNTTFCSGGSVTLTANNGMNSYLWSNGQTTQSITVTASGNYSVAITDSYGCTSNSPLKIITVNLLPNADAGINQSVCLGNSVAIGSSTTSSNTYSWLPTSNLSDAAISNPSASPTSPITYTVTVANSFGCSSTDQVTLSINSLPVVSAGNDVTISQGNSTVVGGSPTASGNSPFTYNWTPMTGLNSNLVANPAASPQNAITYNVTVSDTNGCSASDNIIVTVNPVGCTYILSDSSHNFSNLGGWHIFTVTTSNSGCTWQVNNSLSWLNVSPTNQQTGNGSVTITADSCSNGSTLTGSITIAGIAYNVSQSCTVGINEISNTNSFVIFPNPFTSQTTILFDQEQKNTTIKIMDMLGKEIKTITFNGKQVTIEKGEMKSGIYFLQLIDANKNAVNRKIIVQ